MSVCEGNIYQVRSLSLSHQSSQKMFDRVAVDGDGGDGRHPLVVHLVDVLVDRLVVQESEMSTYYWQWGHNLTISTTP